MKLPPLKPLGSATLAFTLIEVALAMGVAAFVLVAILGLIPLGLSSNKASVEQTEATALMAGVMADLRATPVAVPPVDAISPRFQIPLPASGSAMHTLFLRDDGSAAGAVDTDAVAARNPRYRVTFFVTAPAAAAQKVATAVRVLVTSPAMADPKAAIAPGRSGTVYETVTALNRN